MVQRITTIILAATETGGMSPDFFENKTRHLLPIAGEPLISHLIKALRDERLNKILAKKFIVIGEKIHEFKKERPCESTINEIFPKEINKDILIFGQNPLTKVGTFEAVKECVRYIEQERKEDPFPLLVMYGDCLIKTEFVEEIINQYTKEKSSGKIIWGLVESKNYGDVVVGPIEKNESDGHNMFSATNVVKNIFEYMVSIESESTINILRDTGIMLISKDAWTHMINLVMKIHRPSSDGIYSFTNILKQALIFNGLEIKDIGFDKINIKLKCVIAPETKLYDWYWVDANYPWEFLELNCLKIMDLMETKKESWSEDKIIDIVKNHIIENGLLEEHLFVPKNIEFKLENGTRIIGPCCLCQKIKKIGPNCIISGSFIGEGCKIGSSVVIDKSTFGRNVEAHDGSIIKKSIIMDFTKIYFQSTIIQSLIGSNVMVGVGVRIPCRRLKDFGAEGSGRNNVIYFADTKANKIEKFGAVIGDKCQIGSSAVIHPGRRIGHSCRVYAGAQVIKNHPPNSKISNDLTLNSSRTRKATNGGD